MLHLLPEVLLLIFSLILQKDKLECMTVCHQWRDCIHRHILFCNIYIHKLDQLELLVKRIQKDPVLGTKVERLEMQLEVKELGRAEIFVKLFPNLRDVVIRGTYLHKKNTIKARDQVKIIHSVNILKKIVEDRSDFNTRTLLSSGLCKNLTHISSRAKSSLTAADFIKLLANAPVLKTLEMKAYYFLYSDLDLLHNLVPLLNTLILKRAKFRRSDLPLDIKPAASLKSSKFIQFDGSFIYNCYSYLPYITQKYSQLEELALDLDAFDLEGVFLGTSSIRSKELIASLLRSLGSQLKTLSLNVRFSLRSFYEHFDLAILDECRCKIKHLDLVNVLDSRSFEQLAKTTQVHYIQSLKLNKIPDNNDLVSWDWLRFFFTKLKELILCFPNHEDGKYRLPLSMTKLLKIFSVIHLETLQLHNIKLEFDGSGLFFVHPSLKKLTLVHISFRPKVDLDLNLAFPNVKRLELFSCNTERVRLLLQKTDLSYLGITGVDSEIKFPILVLTSCNNQGRLYNTTSSKPFNDLSEIPQVTVVCNSLNTFLHDEW